MLDSDTINMYGTEKALFEILSKIDPHWVPPLRTFTNDRFGGKPDIYGGQSIEVNFQLTKNGLVIKDIQENNSASRPIPRSCLLPQLI